MTNLCNALDNQLIDPENALDDASEGQEEHSNGPKRRKDLPSTEE